MRQGGKNGVKNIHKYYYFKKFIQSTEPANFIMLYKMPVLPIRYHYKTFEIKNEATKEILELKLGYDNKYSLYKYFLVRHKNDGETTTNVDDLEKQFERKEETMNNIML